MLHRRGSSPHPRGLHTQVTGTVSLCRFIPVPAGFTMRVSASQQEAWVHPRAGGVCLILFYGAALFLGSSRPGGGHLTILPSNTPPRTETP